MPQAAAPFVQRFAVKLRARRLAGPLMLHQCPCGGIVSFNGLLDGRISGTRISSRLSMDPMRALLLSLLLLPFLGPPRTAAACSMCDDALSLTATAKRADLVIVAVRVADEGTVDGGRRHVSYAPFEVRKVFKGTPSASRIFVATHYGMCDYGVEVERDAPSVLFLEAHGGQYDTVRGGCAVRSLPIVNDRVVLSDISSPVDMFGIELGLLPPAAVEHGFPIWLGIVLLCGVMTIGLTAGFWLGRRSSR